MMATAPLGAPRRPRRRRRPSPLFETVPALSATIVAPPVAPVDHPPVTPTGRGLRWDLLVVVMLTALTAAYFNPLLRGHTSSPLGAYQTIDYPWAAIPNPNVLEHPQNDYAELSYPWNVITDDALREGTIPLWSPLIYGGGYEFFANGSSAVLYPPRLLALAVTSPVRAHDLFLVFHIWAAGIAIYLLARQLSVGRCAGTFAAVAWMFVVYAAIGGAAVGAITGALYALVPPRSRSILIAGALGAGMVLACSLLSGLGAVYPLGWIFAVVALATTASMIAGWIVRKLKTGGRSSSADVVVK